ncbi:hypothetical protein quinque_006990 [Culex quinquefasciatus]
MINILLLCLLSVQAILAEVPTGCKDEKQQWLIEKCNENFTIKHKQYGEYMYAHSESDGSERFVRILNSGSVDSDRWKIESKKGTLYSVRNVKFVECLSMAGNNVVVAKKLESCDDDLWEIQPC